MNIIKDIFYDLRKHRILSVLFFIQIIVTVYAVFQGVFYYFLETTAADMSKITYTDFSCHPLIISYSNQDAVNLLMMEQGSDEENRNVMAMYREMKAIDGLEVFFNGASSMTDIVCLEGDYTEIEKSEMKYENPIVKINRIVDNPFIGTKTFSSFKIAFVEHGFTKYFPLSMYAGEYFSESDFENGLDFDVIPVVAGYSFSKYFSVGDTFVVDQGSYGLNGKTLKIIGFLTENSVCADLSYSSMCNIDYLLFLPIPEITDEEAESGKAEIMGFRRIDCSYYLFDRNREQEILEEANAILEKYNMDKYLYFGKTSDAQAIVNNYESNVGLRLFSTVLLLVFSLVSIAFMTVNLLNENIRLYAINILVGATVRNIITRVICSMSAIFIFGGIVGFLYYLAFPYELAKWFLGINGKIDKGLWQKTLSTAPFFVILFFVIAILLCIIISEIKIKKSDLSSLIRDKESKISLGTPVYKIILSIMFAVISVFVVYVVSFLSYSSLSDMYYRHFYTDNTELVSIDVKVFNSEYEPYKYTDLAENYSIHRTVNITYGNNDSKLRGVYYHGEMEKPNMISGRFFTDEEMTSEEYICVVGQKVWNEWTETDENGEKYMKYNGDNYKIIGVMGKSEGEITWLDYYTFIPFGTAIKEYSALGSVVIDSNTRAEVEKITDNFINNLHECYLSGHERYSATAVVPFVTDTFILMLFSALINCVVFGLFYIEKQKKKNTIKKVIGFSRFAVFTDTLGNFGLISLLAFAVGNFIMEMLVKTILSSVSMFKYYDLNIPVILLSFSSVIIICCIFTFISLIKTYGKDTSEFVR